MKSVARTPTHESTRSGTALKALEEYRQIVFWEAIFNPSDASRQRNLAFSWERVGDARQAQGDLAGALQAHEDARVVRERLTTSDPGNADWQRDLSVSWIKLGNVRRGQGDLKGALVAYRASLEINQRLLDQAPNDAQRRLNLSNVLNRMAWLLATAEPKNLRDPKTAIAMARQAVELPEAMDPNIIDTLAMAYFSAGDINRAIETAQQALALIPSPPPPRFVALHEEIQQHLAEFSTAAQQLKGETVDDQ